MGACFVNGQQEKRSIPSRSVAVLSYLAFNEIECLGLVLCSNFRLLLVAMVFQDFEIDSPQKS